MLQPDRRDVLLANAEPALEQLLLSFGLRPQVAEEGSPPSLDTCRAVVCSLSELNRGITRSFLSQYAVNAVNHGLLVVVRAEANSAALTVARELIRQLRLPTEELRQELDASVAEERTEIQAQSESESHKANGLIYGRVIATNVPDPELTRDILLFDPGPRPGIAESEIEGDLPRDPVHMLLLRRAFADFTHVHLTPLGAGLGSDGVYIADGTRGVDALVGRPLPFVAKITSRKKGLVELANFNSFIHDHVPFSARPNMILRRCVVGSKHAVIVSQYVEGSATLAEVVAANSGLRAIDSLFESALRRWRQAASTRGPVTKRPLFGLHIDPPDERRMKQIDAAASHAVSRRLFVIPPKHLLTAMVKAPARPHLRGHIHGDLHAGNVLVTDDSAYLIDFNATYEGPLSLMAARLETTLAFYWQQSARRAGDNEWTRLIEDVYGPRTVGESIREPLRHPPSPSLNRLLAALRRIRAYGIADEVEPHEYACMVAYALLWISSVAVQEGLLDRRAYAYSLASRIVDAFPGSFGAVGGGS